jgi:hypothetical protein
MKDARRRETENAAQATALAKRSAVMRGQEEETSRQLAWAKQHQNSTRETSLESKAIHQAIVVERSDLATRQEAFKSQEVSQKARTAELNLLEETLAKQQIDLDADREKVVTDRAALATAVSDLKRDQEVLADARKDHQRDKGLLDDRRFKVDEEAREIIAAKTQQQDELEFLQKIMSHRIEVKFYGERPLVPGLNSWVEATVNQCSVSEITRNILSLVASVQQERQREHAEALQTKKQLEEIAAEIELMRPERKAQIDTQKAALRAAIAQIDQSSGW